MNYGINSLTIEAQMAGLPEDKTSKKGTLVSNFNVMVPAGFRGDQMAAVRAIAFGRTAEEIRNIRDGETFVIQGKLSVEIWEDRTSGKNRTKLQIQADRILQQLDSQAREQSPEPEPTKRTFKPTPPPAPTQKELGEDDVPF